LAGLPSDYYQTWSLGAQIWLCVFAFFPFLPLAYFVLRLVWKEDYLRGSLLVAFYAWVPLAFYDCVYVGLIKGLGGSYILSHWYLTIFYFIVWIEILFVGWVMQRRTSLDSG
jgi:hypothetical protein